MDRHAIFMFFHMDAKPRQFRAGGMDPVCFLDARMKAMPRILVGEEAKGAIAARVWAVSGMSRMSTSTPFNDFVPVTSIKLSPSFTHAAHLLKNIQKSNIALLGFT